MYRGLVGARGGKETDYAPLFEEPAFITLGVCYEKRPRYSAAAYHPVVKRIDGFLDRELQDALPVREERADKLLALDDRVVKVVDKLKERGMQSPYLKSFVIARINFLRFKKGEAFDFDETVDRMGELADKFNLDNVKREDLARMGGAPAEAEE
jgi:ParB family chromosome partitioning protein